MMSAALPRLILHIGFQKTGTSSLQHFLRINRDALLKQGILYPHAGTDGKVAHHQLALQMNPNATNGAAIPRILDACKTERRQPHHTLLFSSEAFQRLNDFGRMRAFISELNPQDVLVVAYVREFLDYRLSAFRQFVQNNVRFTTLNATLQQQFNIKRKLLSWEQLGHLCLKWYDRATLHDGDIVADLATQCEIDLTGLAPMKTDMNPSLGGNLLYFRMAANAADHPFLSYVNMRELSGAFSTFRKSFFLSDRDALRIRTGHPYNVYLYNRLGPTREKSWESYPVLPECHRLEADFARVSPLLDDPDTLWQKLPLPNVAKSWFEVTG